MFARVLPGDKLISLCLSGLGLYMKKGISKGYNDRLTDVDGVIILICFGISLIGSNENRAESSEIDNKDIICIIITDKIA